MPYTLTQRLQNLGVATPLGKELEAQLTAGTGNLKRLMEVGLVPPLAKYVAAGITANNLSATKLAEYGMVPAVAKMIVASNNAPFNTVLPTITGTAQVGQTLTRTTGTWTGSPTPTYTTQWTANNVAIVGATGATYVPIVGQIGQVIRVVVTGTNTSGSSSATSLPTAAVIAA